jgi:hypothetical protein
LLVFILASEALFQIAVAKVEVLLPVSKTFREFIFTLFCLFNLSTLFPSSLSIRVCKGGKSESHFQITFAIYFQSCGLLVMNHSLQLIPFV